MSGRNYHGSRYDRGKELRRNHAQLQARYAPDRGLTRRALLAAAADESADDHPQPAAGEPCPVSCLCTPCRHRDCLNCLRGAA